MVAGFRRAHAPRGASFVEIFQNCLVYNDGVFAHFTEREVAGDAQVRVKHGEPLIFGAAGDKGLRLKPGSLSLEVATVGRDGIRETDILVHDETNPVLANLLAAMEPPAFPVALGVLYCDPRPSYEAALAKPAAPMPASTPCSGAATPGRSAPAPKPAPWPGRAGGGPGCRPAA